MKKLIVLLFLISGTTFLFSQNQISNTGNVGIGTLTPLYPLEVYGQARFHGVFKMDSTLVVEDSIIIENAKIENDLRIEGDLRMANFAMSGMQAKRPVFVDENGVLVPLGDPCKSDGTGGMVPYWQYYPGVIFVDCPKDVRVGIGTNDPLQNLHVYGTQFITNSLGVGEPNPESRLDVKAAPAFDEISSRFISTSTGLTPQTNEISFVPRLGNGGLNSLSVKNDMGILWSDNYISGQWNKKSGIVIGPANPNLDNPGLRISGLGNIGIGTRNPGKRIEISNGALAITGGSGTDGSVRLIVKDNTNSNDFMKFSNTGGVQLLVDSNGKLYAHEVEVKLGSFPDYVFEDSYKLRSLNELETYINENKHLPGVPDEETVVENGLNLGEMDAILLEKVEELTLYIIEQQKQIIALQNEMKSLNNN